MCNKKAKASLLCDERTYRLCEKEFVFESIGLVKVKGKDEPIPVYRPTAFQKMVKDTMGSYPNLNNELVGRKKEQETIDSALRAYEAGSNVTLVLEAEQGQGLTSLVRYLRRKAADSAMQLRWGYVFSARLSPCAKEERGRRWWGAGKGGEEGKCGGVGRCRGEHAVVRAEKWREGSGRKNAFWLFV
ncbi:MAG: hypothetical protein BJ554DRAFT_8032 [Olpidium bornovanus]|uniref:Uncharacterized protein n=1 Tax=Olpidium bornovanus TaxID=278681 RepID=A0A8H7ZVD8_9FUNG|nr:MAG: hypothetical protein BJ554DRAFT_8032 [Olpidium bornovanus]